MIWNMGKRQHLCKFDIFLSMVIKFCRYSYNIPHSNDLIKNELKLCLLKILYNSIKANFLLKNPNASLLFSRYFKSLFAFWLTNF